MDKNIPQEMVDFIKLNGVMTLATSSEDGSWVCTVYYGVDDDLNFYLVTDPNSIHGKHIEKNPIVAFNIFDSHTKITEPKRGIQGKGTCMQVKNISEIAKGLIIWHSANPGVETKITLSDLKKWNDTKIFKINPTYLKFFDKALYGEKEYGIWEQ